MASEGLGHGQPGGSGVGDREHSGRGDASGNPCSERGMAPAWRHGANTGLRKAEGGALDVVCAQVENRNTASCRVNSVTGTQIALRCSCS